MENIAEFIRAEELSRQIDLDAYFLQFMAELEAECARQFTPEFVQRELPPTREQVRYNRWLIENMTKPGDSWHEWINESNNTRGIALIRDGSIAWATTVTQLVMRSNF